MNPQQKREHQTKQIKANTERVERNEKGWMWAIAISLLLLINSIIYFEVRYHSIEDCQDACFEKLTWIDAPDLEG